jgi:isopenicillin-N epimerase
MHPDRAAAFAFDPSVVLLNHASFGVPTTAALDRLDAEHRRLERDAAGRLFTAMPDELAPARRVVAGLLLADPAQVALTAGSTEASGALAASLPLEPGETVALLDGEYESVIRAWQVRAERSGAHCAVLPLPVPATADAVLGALAAMPAGTRWLVVSAITSSTSLRLPVAHIVALAAERGVRVVLDAAHVVGHEPFDAPAAGVAAAFGSLHKWLPVPRSVGFCWVAPDLLDVVHPAAAAIRYDEPFADRFAWRGTWDPAAALGLPAAVDEWRTWSADGWLDEAAALADRADELLSTAGWLPTGAPDLRPARLRAFVVRGTDAAHLANAARAAGLRIWTGTLPDGRTLARLATHVWTTADDLARVAAAARTTR